MRPLYPHQVAAQFQHRIAELDEEIRLSQETQRLHKEILDILKEMNGTRKLTWREL